MKEVEECQQWRKKRQRQESTLKEATEETKKEYIKNICNENMEF